MSGSGLKISMDLKGLKELEKKVDALSGEKAVSLEEIMPDSFVRANTDFNTLQKMFDAGGVRTPENINSEAFSKFIAARTRFPNWTAMLEAATQEYFKRKLGF